MQKQKLTRTHEINTYLDYELCERSGQTLEELDSLPLAELEELRESLWKEWIAEGIGVELI